LEQGLKVTFEEGIMTPVDPLFADPANGDFHLKLTAGRRTATGRVTDTIMSPAIAKGHGGGGDNPERASAAQRQRHAWRKAAPQPRSLRDHRLDSSFLRRP
jgi:hypothetical protein